MIWSIREARARVEGEGARRGRGWRRLVFVIAIAWIERLFGWLFADGGESWAVSVPSVGSKVCSDGLAAWVSGVRLAD
jgi:hypothetical protein